MVGKGDRDPTLACEGGLGYVMSQLSEEGMPGPRLHPQHKFSEQVFSGEMTQGKRGKTRRLKRAKCLLRVGETGSLLMETLLTGRSDPGLLFCTLTCSC